MILSSIQGNSIMKAKTQLVIHFMDGNKVSFNFDEQSHHENVTAYGENLLKDQYIAIEADGSMFVYPLQNIKSMQIYPAPKILPNNIIKHASLTEED